MYKDLLPLGSIVKVAEQNINLMISGRVVCRKGDPKVYDYLAVEYPFGLSDSSNMIFFDEEAVESVIFIGCTNDIEKAFKEEVLAPLDDAASIENVDGQIVVK